MRSWLRRRRERLERVGRRRTRSFSTLARPPIPKRAAANMRLVPTRWRESGAGSRWRLRARRARPSPECIDSITGGRQAGGAIPDSILWRSNRSRANHLGGSRPAGFGRVHSDTPSGSRCMASSRDWILRDRSRGPRSLRTAEGRSLVGVMHDARSSLRGRPGRREPRPADAFLSKSRGTP